MLHAKIQRVDNPKRAVWRDRNLCGEVELAGVQAALTDPLNNFPVEAKNDHFHGDGVDYTEPFALLVGQLAYEGGEGPELAYRFERFGR